MTETMGGLRAVPPNLLSVGKWLILLLALVLVGMIYHCSVTPDTYRTDSTLVEAVYLNDSNSVSYLHRSGGALIVTKVYGELKFYDDVAPGNQSYVTVTEVLRAGAAIWSPVAIAIHVHKVGEVQPGAWEYGKGGHGIVHKIE